MVKDDVQLLNDDDVRYLQRLCEEKKVSFSLFNDLLNMEKANAGYNRRTEAIKHIRSKFSQEYLVLTGNGDTDEDN